MFCSEQLTSSAASAAGRFPVAVLTGLSYSLRLLSTLLLPALFCVSLHKLLGSGTGENGVSLGQEVDRGGAVSLSVGAVLPLSVH